MFLDFPASPQLNDTYTFGGKTWKYDGVSWVLQTTGIGGTSGGGTTVITGESYWVKNQIGIHTLSNVGIGTTIPQENLSIMGDLSLKGNLNAGRCVIVYNDASQSLDFNFEL